MIKKEYLGREVTDLSFHDSCIHEIIWLNDGQDISLTITWLPPLELLEEKAGEILSLLRFVWVSDLKISIDYEDFMGAPSIYNIVFEELGHKRWKVVFEFRGSPKGEISFECNDISLFIKDPL